MDGHELSAFHLRARYAGAIVGLVGREKPAFPGNAEGKTASGHQRGDVDDTGALFVIRKWRGRRDADVAEATGIMLHDEVDLPARWIELKDFSIVIRAANVFLKEDAAILTNREVVKHVDLLARNNRCIEHEIDSATGVWIGQVAEGGAPEARLTDLRSSAVGQGCPTPVRGARTNAAQPPRRGRGR